MDFIYCDAVWDTPEASADIICQNPQRVKCGQQGYDMSEADIQAMREGLNDTQRFVFDAIMREVEPDQMNAPNWKPRRHYDRIRDCCHRDFRLYQLDEARGYKSKTHASEFAKDVLYDMLCDADNVIAECGWDEQKIRQLFTHYVYKAAERKLEEQQRLTSLETLGREASDESEGANEDSDLESLGRDAPDKAKGANEDSDEIDDKTRISFAQIERFFTERGYEREFRYLCAALALIHELKRFESDEEAKRVPHGTHQILADALLISPQNSRTLMKNTVRVFNELKRDLGGHP